MMRGYLFLTDLISKKNGFSCVSLRMNPRNFSVLLPCQRTAHIHHQQSVDNFTIEQQRSSEKMEVCLPFHVPRFPVRTDPRFSIRACGVAMPGLTLAFSALRNATRQALKAKRGRPNPAIFLIFPGLP